MACRKYLLTNNTSSNGVFSYQECSNQMWNYNVLLPAGESCNIWLIDGTYSTAMPTIITVYDFGLFPFVVSPTPTATNTPTPTQTPTNTATNTPTPSITATNTPTQTATSTPTETPTQTPTQTETPTQTPSGTPTNTPTTSMTPTPTISYWSYLLTSGATSIDACASLTTFNVYSSSSQPQGPTVGDFLFLDTSLTNPVNDGYWSDGTSAFIVINGNGFINNETPC